MAKLATKNYGIDADSGLTRKLLVKKFHYLEDDTVVLDRLDVLQNPGNGMQTKGTFTVSVQASAVFTPAQITKIKQVAQDKLDSYVNPDDYKLDPTYRD